jgi:hypothetical protein
MDGAPGLGVLRFALYVKDEFVADPPMANCLPWVGHP